MALWVVITEQGRVERRCIGVRSTITTWGSAGILNRHWCGTPECEISGTDQVKGHGSVPTLFEEKGMEWSLLVPCREVRRDASPQAQSMWCFLLLALWGSRRISLNAPHWTWTFCGQNMQRPVVSPITGGWESCDMSCPPGGTGRDGTESGDQAHCTLSAVRHPTRVWGSLGLSERDSQCQNTLWGLTHHASGCELERKTPPDHHWIPGRKVTIRETDLPARWLYYSLLIFPSGGRDTTTYTVDEDMTQDITRYTQR